MFKYSDHCGIEKDYFSEEQILKLVNEMKSFDSTPIPEGQLFGVDHNHPQYNWFMKEFFVHLQTYTNRPDLKLIFGMYADVTESFKIHRDIKPLPNSEPPNRHYASFLIPISIENETEKCKKNCTFVFENALLTEPEFNQYWHDRVAQTPDIPYYKLVKDITWEPYSLIWWNSLFPHAGADLPSLELSTKQMIVAHTYV